MCGRSTHSLASLALSAHSCSLVANCDRAPSLCSLGQQADAVLREAFGPVQGDAAIRAALREGSVGSAQRALGFLEEQFASDGPLKFSRLEIELFVNDRALAPNTSETFNACKI